MADKQSKLDEIFKKHFGVDYSQDTANDAPKAEIKTLFKELAETHADENNNVNLASLVGEIDSL